ncbi:hypothetical protein VP01_725g3 [Puccinia sorghi]|uniref:Uncharacterized protein n=1 Tax=Puccinia sorghi TaxID=27349 RepID=A0A0L6UD26_9BASI|nr:hypothetical protein VP01_725g3 [Puccinia sorghi]
MKSSKAMHKINSTNLLLSLKTLIPLLRSSMVRPHCKKLGHQPSNCWVKHPNKAPKTHSAHLTVVDKHKQLHSVTNWCTLPESTHMNADNIA